MQTVADMRGVGVKNREKFEDVLCGRPPFSTKSIFIGILTPISLCIIFGKTFEIPAIVF